MSEGAHIRIELVDDCQNGSVSAVGFGIGEYINLLKAGDKVDIAYTMNEYCFRGDSTLSLHLCDIKPHFDDSFIWNKAVIAEKLFSSGLGMKQIAKMAQGEDAISQMIPTPEQFGACYRTIEKFGEGLYVDRRQRPVRQTCKCEYRC
jgi:single-stranded-DNA-specific exonuclease